VDLYVGSSSESRVGVGNLLRWDVDAVVGVDFNPRREQGAWLITDTTGTEWYCSDLMLLSPTGGVSASIEEDCSPNEMVDKWYEANYGAY
jgi:hypothetical protein